MTCSQQAKRFAYADPPYIGQAKKHYDREEVCHESLVAQLQSEYPDGWALSLSSVSLEEILHICRRVLGPNKVRTGAWVKPFCSFKKNVNPAFAWEPVIFRGGRKRGTRIGLDTERDWCAESITLRKGLSGVKPLGVCYWIFEMLGMEPQDEFCDLFPGSGAVTKAWEMWRAEVRVGEKE
jgi:hypothetical protein